MGNRNAQWVPRCIPAEAGRSTSRILAGQRCNPTQPNPLTRRAHRLEAGPNGAGVLVHSRRDREANDDDEAAEDMHAGGERQQLVLHAAAAGAWRAGGAGSGGRSDKRGSGARRAVGARSTTLVRGGDARAMTLMDMQLMQIYRNMTPVKIPYT